jgi:hypothetical protein
LEAWLLLFFEHSASPLLEEVALAFASAHRVVADALPYTVVVELFESELGTLVVEQGVVFAEPFLLSTSSFPPRTSSKVLLDEFLKLEQQCSQNLAFVAISNFTICVALAYAMRNL